MNVLSLWDIFCNILVQLWILISNQVPYFNIFYKHSQLFMRRIIIGVNWWEKSNKFNFTQSKVSTKLSIIKRIYCLLLIHLGYVDPRISCFIRIFVALYRSYMRVSFFIRSILGFCFCSGLLLYFYFGLCEISQVRLVFFFSFRYVTYSWTC